MACVLVAYATKYGATREVADAVAAAFREHGVKADVRPARDVRSLDGYSAVVLGGALYFFRWHSDARRFLARHRKALSKVPAAVFALGPIDDTPDGFADARKHLDGTLTKASWLAPVSVAVFGGRVEPSALRFPDNNPAFKAMPPSDIRDWTAIRAWADSLVEPLGLSSRTVAE
jgi:menaquinone-dependent protoporphyrinogen oxidase